MTVEHYFVVKWTERDGFVLDDETLMIRFDDRPLYEVESVYHDGVMGEDGWLRIPKRGKVADRDAELHLRLSDMLTPKRPRKRRRK